MNLCPQDKKTTHVQNRTEKLKWYRFTHSVVYSIFLLSSNHSSISTDCIILRQTNPIPPKILNHIKSYCLNLRSIHKSKCNFLLRHVISFLQWYQRLRETVSNYLFVPHRKCRSGCQTTTEQLNKCSIKNTTRKRKMLHACARENVLTNTCLNSITHSDLEDK